MRKFAKPTVLYFFTFCFIRRIYKIITKQVDKFTVLVYNYACEKHF